MKNKHAEKEPGKTTGHLTVLLEEMLTKLVQVQKLGGGSGGLVLEATLGGRGSEKEGKR
jgi:hypothetical protein